MLEARFGKGRIWQRTTKYFDELDVADDVAVAIIQGLRGEGHRYLAACQARGIPTLVLDLGWLRRERGYWQASLGGLNVPPPIAPSGDRFEELDLKVFQPTRVDYNTVIVGQLPGDMQHDLAADADMARWGQEAAAACRAAYPYRKIYWRPHPLHRHTLGRPTIMTNPDRSFIEFIKEARVGSAIVYNSSAGIELLRLGVRVVAQGPRTVYSHLTPTSVGELEQAHPGVEQVKEMLERLAYGQYKLEELSDWSTLEKLFELHGIIGDW